MKYYRQLIQQGYPPMAAAQYTKQYFPEFQDPIRNYFAKVRVVKEQKQ